MSKKRVLAKAKIYGFSPWVDQLNAINQIMEDTGERNESAILRKLVDEALEARRRKSQSALLIEESDPGGGRLETTKSLLMDILRQGDVSIRMTDVCIALIQDILAETYATRRLLWESLVFPKLLDEGIDLNELERRFVRQLDAAKEFAYGLAERIKESQDSLR